LSKQQHNAQIDVVILNFNTREILAKCLPQVIEYSQHPWVNIVVADNNSTDGSADFVEREFPGVELIRLSENTGFAGGYNRALEGRKADYFLLLNSDAEPVNENWLSSFLELIKKHPNLGAAQPQLLDYKFKTQQRKKFEYAGAAGGYIDHFGFPFCRGRIFGNVEFNDKQYDSEQSIFWATGAAMFVKREAWEKAGGLDESFFAHMEEIDLCWRLQTLGYDILSCPESMVYHIGGATLSNQNPRKTFLNFRNGLMMLYKNLPAETRNSIILKRKLFDGLAGLFFMIQGKPKHTVQIIKAHREFDRLKTSLKLNPNSKPINQLKGVLKHSLVIGYFFKGKKTWSSWATNWT
jgi:GT2 family glycosyltransferase